MEPSKFDEIEPFVFRNTIEAKLFTFQREGYGDFFSALEHSVTKEIKDTFIKSFKKNLGFCLKPVSDRFFYKKGKISIGVRFPKTRKEIDNGFPLFSVFVKVNIEVKESLRGDALATAQGIIQKVLRAIKISYTHLPQVKYKEIKKKLAEESK
ncbi:MAG: hypothetical protein ABIF92_02880 [archaeon]